MLLWNTNPLKRFKTGWLIHVNQTTLVTLWEWTDFCPKTLALCHETQSRVRWSAGFLVTKIKCILACFQYFVKHITQNVLCLWKEICSGLMWVIIKTEREREKEGPGAASLNSISSAGSHWPMEQEVACGGSRRVQNVITQDISLIRSILTKSVSFMYLDWGKIKRMRGYN